MLHLLSRVSVSMAGFTPGAHSPICSIQPVSLELKALKTNQPNQLLNFVFTFIRCQIMDRVQTVIPKTKFRTNNPTFFTLDYSVFSSNCVCLARSPVLKLYQVLSLCCRPATSSSSSCANYFYSQLLIPVVIQKKTEFPWNCSSKIKLKCIYVL